MTGEDVMNLLFMPGFSTAPQASPVSGRGVGLDVVRNNVQGAGGNVILHGEPGIATRVTLQMPVSMAVMDVLLAETGGEHYAFPFAAILEVTAVRRSQIQVVNGREAIPYRGTVLGLQHLKEILEPTAGEKLRDDNSAAELSVIVLGFGGEMRGIVVDRIPRRQGILSRPLEAHMARIAEFSGAALLGDGRIVLILDPAGFF